MNNLITKRFLSAAIMAAALITPAIASAQDLPSYASAGNQQLRGRIASINGTWNITVNDTNGYTDSVELHQGTIINPTGLTLEPGMDVTIDGYPDGSNFAAMEIDTSYRHAGPAPSAVYYRPGLRYPGYAYGAFAVPQQHGFTVRQPVLSAPAERHGNPASRDNHNDRDHRRD